MRHFVWIVFLVGTVAACEDTGDSGPAFEPIQVSGLAGDARTPDLVMMKKGPLVVWSEDRGQGPDLYVAGFDMRGKALGEHRLTENGAARWPRLAKVGDQLLVVWVDRRDGMKEVWVARLDPASGSLSGQTNLSNSPLILSTHPRIAAHEDGAWVIWTERGPLFSVERVALDSTGSPLAEAEQEFAPGDVPHRADLALGRGRAAIVASHFIGEGWSAQLVTHPRLDRPGERKDLSEALDGPIEPVIALLDNGLMIASIGLSGEQDALFLTFLSDEGEVFLPLSFYEQGAVYSGASITAGDTGSLALARSTLDHKTGLLAVVVRAGGEIIRAETIIDDIGLGEAVAGRISGDSACFTWERMHEGLGSVHLSCLEPEWEP